jgi:YHS domain-containing protein
MGWLVRVILFTLLIALLVRAAGRLFRGIVEGASGRSGARPPAPRGTKMVKDPVCGTYVVQSKALTASRGSETAFFCSPECQHAWQRR